MVLGAAVLILTGALLPFIFADRKFSYIDGSPGYEMVLGACYLSACILALFHFRQVTSVFSRSKPLISLMVLALVSAIWAESPALALRRSLALFGTTLIGALLTARFTPTERIQLLSFTLRVLAVGSLLVSVFLPHYGVESTDPLHLGDWVGVYGNKNKLGDYTAIAFLIDCFRPMGLQSKFIWFGLYMLLLVKSGSASPLASLLATWLIIKAFQRMRKRHHLSVRAIALSIVVAIGASVAAGLGSGFFQLIFGRSADLTGRIELWRALMPAILQHPILGYGYGSFWAGASGEYYTVARQLLWVPMYSHNGYLETLVSLGAVGLVLACSFLARGGFYALRKADFEESREDLFPLALLVYFLISNITECTILYPNSLEWAFCVATLLGVMPPAMGRLRSDQVVESHNASIVSEEYA